MPKNVIQLHSNPSTLESTVHDADLVIGSVLIPGAKAPKLVTKAMLKNMRKGSVLVDIAIDQGGCFETSKPTTHKDPVFTEDGIVHYAVTNMPGAVPIIQQSITNATARYTLQLANMGWKAAKANPSLALGVNMVEGKSPMKCRQAFNTNYVPLNAVLS